MNLINYSMHYNIALYSQSVCVVKKKNAKNYIHESSKLGWVALLRIITRGGYRISGKGVHMYKGVGVALLFLSHFT